MSILNVFKNVATHFKNPFRKNQGSSKDPKSSSPSPPENVLEKIEISTITVEVGKSLLRLVSPKHGGELVTRMQRVRFYIGLELGIVMPGIRFRDNLVILPEEYIIKIKDKEAARGSIFPDKLFAVGSDEQLKKIQGDNAFLAFEQIPGKWIDKTERQTAEALGCNVLEPVGIVANHIQSIVREQAAELLGFTEVWAFVYHLKKNHPTLVESLIPDKSAIERFPPWVEENRLPKDLSIWELRIILQNLLREKISIRDLVTIFEVLGEAVVVDKIKDLNQLTNLCKKRLLMSVTSPVHQTLLTIYRQEHGSDEKLSENQAFIARVEALLLQGLSPGLIYNAFLPPLSKLKKYTIRNENRY